MTTLPSHGIYGAPPDALTTSDPSATQFSPLRPGAAALEAQPAGTLASFVMAAPAGTVERRYALALMLQALAPDAPFTILAPKDRGGARLAGELAQFGCAFTEEARRHHRICSGRRPAALPDLGAALRDGASQVVAGLGLVSQPGVFSWDRLDPASALLLPHLDGLAGRGADFGCGIGVLALGALAAPKVTELTLIDIDRRAIEAARRNVVDPRATLLWADLREPDPRDSPMSRLDFVVANPPFHDGGAEDRSLGQTFIRRAAAALRTGGRFWLTANRHLPYEAVLQPLFKRVTLAAQASGYKVFEAQK